jgi:hypothetical protein
MTNNAKHDLKKRARIARGILNLLTDDLDQIRVDADDFDLICLEDSIQETRRTLQMLTDNITEMEYMLYLIKTKSS